VQKHKQYLEIVICPKCSDKKQEEKEKVCNLCNGKKKVVKVTSYEDLDYLNRLF